MRGIDRRRMLRDVFGAAAAATVGLTLMADAGEATPLALEKDTAAKAADLVEQAGSRPGPWRRGRRWRCWWNRWGQRQCGWRWW